jgi:hypothetical protein
VLTWLCVGAAGVFNLFESLLAGIVVFIGGFIFGQWVTNADPATLRILAQSDSGQATTPPSTKFLWSRCDECAAWITS